MSMDVAVRVPMSLVFEQGASLRALGHAGLLTAFPFLRPRVNPTHFTSIETEVRAPSDRLIDTYLRWCGAVGSRYAGEIPAHLFSQWSIPLVERILTQASYPLTAIVNQGCTLRVNAPLPRGRNLKLRARLAELEETEERVRFAVEVQTGTIDRSDALVAVFHLVLVRRRGAKKPVDVEEVAWETVGRWSVVENDGFNFALLTGDFNPVHWVGWVARFSPFGRKVLQGFGSFARTCEALLAAEPPTARLHAIDVRFVRPVPLPAEDLVVARATVANADGSRKLQLATAAGKAFIIGEYRAR